MEAALTLFVVIFLIGIALTFYSKILRVYNVVDNITNFVLTPFRYLGDAISPWFERIPSNLIWVVLFLPFVLFILFLVLAGIFLIEPGSFWQTIFDNTTMMTLMNVMFVNKLDPSASINYAAMVSVGFSSALSFLIMHHTTGMLKDKISNEVLSTLLCILLGFLSFCAFAIFAEISTDWCADIAQFLLSFFKGLFSSNNSTNSFLNFLILVWDLILAAILLCAAIITFLMVLREYLAVFCYGLFSLALVFAAWAIFQYLWPAPDYIQTPVILVVLFSADFIRNSDTLNEIFTTISESIQNHFK